MGSAWARPHPPFADNIDSDFVEIESQNHIALPLAHHYLNFDDFGEIAEFAFAEFFAVNEPQGHKFAL